MRRPRLARRSSWRHGAPRYPADPPLAAERRELPLGTCLSQQSACLGRSRSRRSSSPANPLSRSQISIASAGCDCAQRRTFEYPERAVAAFSAPSAHLTHFPGSREKASWAGLLAAPDQFPKSTLLSVSPTRSRHRPRSRSPSAFFATRSGSPGISSFGSVVYPGALLLSSCADLADFLVVLQLASRILCGDLAQRSRCFLRSVPQNVHWTERPRANRSWPCARRRDRGQRPLAHRSRQRAEGRKPYH